jgi:hypothetical protein
VEWAHRFCEAVTGLFAASETALFAQTIGYEVYVRIARLGVCWLHASHNPGRVVPPSAAETQQILSCVVTALDFMTAAWLANETCLNYEVAFMMEAQRARDEISGEHRDALAAALDRLAGSGVLEKLDVVAAMQDTRRLSKQLVANAQAEKEAPERQSCAHCGARELHVDHFKRCSACKGPRFCSKDCQLANWPQHKAACKAARKAAAGAAAGA